MKTNGFEVEKKRDGYLFKVTPNLIDVMNDFQNFVDRRAILKSLFADDVFAYLDSKYLSSIEMIVDPITGAIIEKP